MNADLNGKSDNDSDDDEKMEMSQDEAEKPDPEIGTPAISATPLTPADQLVNGDRLKRKRSEEEESNGGGLDDVESTPSKRLRSETPPPPPPPPAESSPEAVTASNGHDPSAGADLDAKTKHGPTTDDIDMDPHSSAPEGPVYTEHDEATETGGASNPPLFFNDINRTPSDGDAVEMDQRNLSIRGMGTSQMPEVEVQQGH